MRLVARGWVAALLGLSQGLLLAAAVEARRDRLDLSLSQISLPGAPASVLPVDFDRDGVGDLVIVVAYTEWDRISVSETVESEQVEGLVEMMTVVPALADRRELQLWLGIAANGRTPGGFRRAASMPLDRSVITVLEGPPAEPVLALTDEGVASLREVHERGGDDEAGRPSVPGERRLRFETLLEIDTVFSGTGALLPGLELSGDLDGDGVVDLLVPQSSGLALYRGAATGLEASPLALVPLPPAYELQKSPARRRYPLPRIEDVDGDGSPDLVFRHPTLGWQRFWVARSLGDGRFQPLEAPLGEGPAEAEEVEAGEGSIVHFGDLDSDGLAELVRVEDLSDQDAGWRKEMKQSKRPPVRLHVIGVASNGIGVAGDGPLTLEEESRASFRATGYGFTAEENEEGPGSVFPGGFADLDGDGRQDLVTITLDFSLLQAVRVLATRTLSIGLDFHVWCQEEGGGFREVPDLDLSGKIKLRIDDLRLGQLSQFAGDFDGDGRRDFVQMGRGRKVTIHRGREDCRYPDAPDLTLELEEEPRDLALVRVDDYDGDGYDDLLVIQPLRRKEAARRAAEGASLPVRLDLYTSAGSAEVEAR